MFNPSLSNELLQENRARLMAVLTTLAVRSVTINYVGGGDFGDVCDLEISPPELLTQLEQTNVVMRYVRGEWHDGKYHPSLADQTVPLQQALTDFTLDWLNSVQGGWENNDGGQGAVIINVHHNSCSLEHTEFYTETNDYVYSL